MKKRRRPNSKGQPQQTAAGPEARRQSRLEPQFLEDLQYWIQVDPRMADRILDLVKATLREPFTGIGKPEALRKRNGIWARRINEEHRLTYRVTDEHVDFLQARFHYTK